MRERVSHIKTHRDLVAGISEGIIEPAVEIPLRGQAMAERFLYRASLGWSLGFGLLYLAGTLRSP